MSDEWIDKAEIGVEAVLAKVPYIGELISVLVDIFWPHQQVDVWAEIKDRVEKVIDGKISQADYNRVTASLGDSARGDGLIGALANYTGSISKTHSNKQDPKQTWTSTNTAFITASASFMQSGCEVLLLPLFAQMANLHLSLLRDGVINGYCDISEMTNSDPSYELGKLVVYANYADKWVAQAIADRKAKAGVGFNGVNDVARFMQLSVGNFREMWPYFDPIAYPKGATGIASKKEIYYPISEAAFQGAAAKKQGWAPAAGINLNHIQPSAPAAEIANLDVYCYFDGVSGNCLSLFSGAEVHYASGSSTPYTGLVVSGQKPPANSAAHTGPWRPMGMISQYWTTVPFQSGSPIVRVSGLYDSNGSLYFADFFYADGTSTGAVPEQNGALGNQTFASNYNAPLDYEVVAPDGYALSSVWVLGGGLNYGAREVLLGFRIGG